MNGTDYITSVFTFGRAVPFPAIYPENKTPVTVDVLEVGWIVAFITGYLGFLLLLPATVGKEKGLYFIRITMMSFIGLVVVLCNFGQEWERGDLKAKMFYKAGSSEEIEGHVGVKLGLRSVNITLYADPDTLEGDLMGEKIDYNDRFHWTWEQGRAGFGPFAGRIQREFREAQLKGAPYPILWVAEYFTFDGEGLRLGRHYRHAGWYAHICLWCAFVSWILSVVLFKIFIRYGAILLSLLGCFLTLASLIWCSYRNFNELAVVFSNDDTNGVLRTHYGVHWYLSLIVGIFCIVCGVSIAVADLFWHDELCKFFGVDPYGIIDEVYEENAETATETVPSNHIELEEKSKLKARRQQTVTYVARGTKKLWKKNKPPAPVWDNDDYFNISNNPTVDPNYLDIGYMNPYPHNYPTHHGEFLHPNQYGPDGGVYQYDPSAMNQYPEGNDLWYQDVQPTTNNPMALHQHQLQQELLMQQQQQQQQQLMQLQQQQQHQGGLDHPDFSNHFDVSFENSSPPPRPPKPTDII